MIVVTGATGTIGRALVGRLLEAGHEVRCLVRDPRRLGRDRVRVQLGIVDLAHPRGLRHALRGAETVIHLAASIRDEPGARIESVNALGTHLLMDACEEAGVERVFFFSALGATSYQRTRFFRSKFVAERRVLTSPIPSTIVAPSIVYDISDRWIRLQSELALLPWIPVPGSGRAEFEPIWADDVARCMIAALDDPRERIELAGPGILSYRAMARLIAAAAGRPRQVLPVPLGLTKVVLRALERHLGPSTPATAEEAELMTVPMVSENGTADALSLGVVPAPMTEVIGGAGPNP